MISFNEVTFGYGQTPLLKKVSFTLPAAGAVCFSGPSGCGKTTLLRLIAGLEHPASGTILRPADQKIAMVFQENRLLPWLTVQENVALVCTDAIVVSDALEAVALADAADKYPDELSGGMQRRTALARALAYGGDLLILDEPFTGLDESLARSIAEKLRRRFADKPILLVTHSEREPAWFDAAVCPLTSPLERTIL